MAFKINKDFFSYLETSVEEDTKVSKVSKASKDAKANKVIKVSKDAKVTKVSQDTSTSDTRGSKKKTVEFSSPDVIREMLTKDNGKGYKEYLEVSVKRFSDEGIPYVNFSTRVESEMYNGYKKGKHICFPLELLYDFLDLMNEVDEECDKKHIE